MTYTRRIWALPALALTLILAACSTPENLNVPTLEPQFGTAYDDRPVRVAAGPSGASYTLYNYVEPGGYYDDGGYYYEYYHVDVAVLTRYNATGGVAWERDVLRRECDYEYCSTYRAEAVFVDANNYTYVLTSGAYDDEPDGPGPSVSFTVYKYAPLGEEVGSYELDYYDNYRSSVTFKLAVDAGGNMYVAAQGYDYGAGDHYLAKYTSTGGLVWNRTSSTTPAYGTPTDIEVSSSGSIYVVGTKGFSRYSSSGDMVWNKIGTFEQVSISGSNLYTRYRKDIRRYDGTGKQLWLRSQSGLNTMIFQGMDGDGSGNVYLSGKYQASTGNYSPMVRKLNSSGTVLWTKTYGTSAYDDAISIATVSGSEIYVSGETQGSLAHSNRGGVRDGYIRKFSSTGGTVWTK